MSPHSEPSGASETAPRDPAAWLGASIAALGLNPDGGPFHARRLEGGVSSDVYEVSVKGRTVCIKRPLPRLLVQADWRAPLERGYREQAWLTFAHRIRPGAVPRVVATEPSSPTFAMEFLDPDTFVTWKSALLEGHVDSRVATQLGRDLGHLHAAGTDPDAMRTFSDQSIFDALRIDPYLRTTQAAHPELAPHIGRLIDETLQPHTVIHGDVSPKNVLVSSSRVVLLDAECASVGDPAFDLAFCLTHLVLKTVRRPAWKHRYHDAARAFVDGYLDTSASDAQLLPRTTRMLGGILLARIDGKSPIEYLDEPQRNVVRAIASKVLREEPSRPLEVMDLVLEQL